MEKYEIKLQFGETIKLWAENNIFIGSICNTNVNTEMVVTVEKYGENTFELSVFENNHDVRVWVAKYEKRLIL